MASWCHQWMMRPGLMDGIGSCQLNCIVLQGGLCICTCVDSSGSTCACPKYRRTALRIAAAHACHCWLACDLSAPLPC